ncbi:hypothetical protein ACFQ07_01390 [Actinomadura adrarensis]|uniref:Uncharacterized protein n=1 Tax=Actinomadura adrarensis TaxID=1819600 RepID=A0ABW3C8M9_9ACTN
MNSQMIPVMPERWWVSVPEMSDAFQVEMVSGDSRRSIWWGNQAVGHATRRATVPERWSAEGRDHVLLPNEAAKDLLYPSALDALVRTRDAWRRRTVTLSNVLGKDYWIEPRPALGLESLWLGRTHLGYIRPTSLETFEAFTTNDDPIGQRTYPARDKALLAVQGAWRAHLNRVLRINRPHR